VFLPYARVLHTPGVRSLYVAGVLGALAPSMVTPGVLLLVGHASGSLARAGLASGALAVGNGVDLVVQGLVAVAGLAGCLVPAVLTGVRRLLPEAVARATGRPPTRCWPVPSRRTYATSGRVISGDRRCSARLGPVRGTVLQVATAVPAWRSSTSRTRCGVVMR
jgi:hypothetical protein